MQRRTFVLSAVAAGSIAGLGTLWYAEPAHALVIALFASVLALLWCAVVVGFQVRRGARFSREQQPRWVVSDDGLTWHLANGSSTTVPWPLVLVRRGPWGYHLTLNKRGEQVLAFRSFRAPEDRATFESIAEQAGVFRA